MRASRQYVKKCSNKNILELRAIYIANASFFRIIATAEKYPSAIYIANFDLENKKSGENCRPNKNHSKGSHRPKARQIS
jgi:hypothetical protein